MLVTRLIHVESGEEIKSEMPLFLPENMGAKPQFAWGGGLTYGRRYAIKMLLGIEPDMDTNTETDTELGDVKEPPPKKTGISRTPTRPDSQVKKVEEKNNDFMTPAAREEIGSKITDLPEKDKAKVLSAFKQEFNISANQISPQHITLASHGQFLHQAIEKLV